MPLFATSFTARSHMASWRKLIDIGHRQALRAGGAGPAVRTSRRPRPFWVMTVDDKGMAVATPGAVANGIGEVRMAFFERLMDVLNFVGIVGRPQPRRGG